MSPHRQQGGGWYTQLGTGDVSKNPWGGSKGTKIFSLVGKVNNTGLVEVPMGVTLREVIFEIGAGSRRKEIQGVQTGGPRAGACRREVPRSAVDFDRLTEVGSMMGSAA